MSVIEDPWAHLRALTPARIALGRAGAGLPTAAHLAFRLDHARARRAVHLPLETARIAAQAQALGLGALCLESAAPDRATYLQRPDLGRQLSEAARARVPRGGRCDLALVVGDGLSAEAVHRNALPFLAALLPALAGWRLGPLAVVEGARVAIGDEIGARLGAQIVVVLIGERPGLSSPDSLGLYLTHGPRPGLTDAARNCISNVREAGLSHHAAAHKLMFLLTQARLRGLSGVALKDEAEDPPPLPGAGPRRLD